MATQIQSVASVIVLILLAAGLTSAQTAAAQQAPTSSPAVVGELKDLPLTAEQRQSYVGEYTVTDPEGVQTPFRITEVNGVLHGEPDGQGSKRLLFQGEHRFRPEGIPEFTLTFVVDDDRATGFTARIRDRELRGVRNR